MRRLVSSFSHDMTVEKSSLYVEKVQHFIVFTVPNADRFGFGAATDLFQFD